LNREDDFFPAGQETALFLFLWHLRCEKGGIGIMDFIQSTVDAVNGVVWGWLMLILLVGTHIFLTLRLRFIQAHVFKGIKLTFSKDKGASGDVSQWGALATALAATLGTGNIVGVATGVVRGGPGAVLWLWITGLFGIATKYGEAVAAVKYRVRTSDGTMLGGPMYACERGLGMKWLGVLFSIFASIACFGIGNLVQVNSIVGNFESTFGVPSYVTGLALTIFTFIVIVGGIRSIAKVAEFLIPFMAIFFFLACFILLVNNWAFVGQALNLIITSAFSMQAAVGGFTGYTVMQAARFGIARGLFSNEAGLGSAPIAAAAAVTRNPVRQGLVSMSQVFWDTIILCAVTGTMYVTCVLKWPLHFMDEAGELVRGVTFASTAFELGFGGFGAVIVTITILTFAWTTILGWSYYGERAVEYLAGKKGIQPFKIVYSLAVFLGSLMAVDLVFDIADMFNAFMAIPNLISLIALSGLIAKITKEYLWDKNLDGVDPDPIMEIRN